MVTISDPAQDEIRRMGQEVKAIWAATEKDTRFRRELAENSDIMHGCWHWRNGRNISLYTAVKILKFFGYRLKIEKIEK